MRQRKVKQELKGKSAESEWCLFPSRFKQKCRMLRPLQTACEVIIAVYVVTYGPHKYIQWICMASSNPNLGQSLLVHQAYINHTSKLHCGNSEAPPATWRERHPRPFCKGTIMSAIALIIVLVDRAASEQRLRQTPSIIFVYQWPSKALSLHELKCHTWQFRNKTPRPQALVTQG